MNLNENAANWESALRALNRNRKLPKLGDECPECGSRKMLWLSDVHQQCPAKHCKHKEVVF